MNGYTCPCCGKLIATAEPRQMRECPSCKASVKTQKIEKQKIISRIKQEQSHA